MLDETVGADERFEGRAADEVVLDAVGLAGAGGAGGVWFGGKGRLACLLAFWWEGWEGGEVRETLKPNVSGWSAKRRFRIVDLPAPLGPEITMGRGEECMVVEVEVEAERMRGRRVRARDGSGRALARQRRDGSMYDVLSPRRIEGFTSERLVAGQLTSSESWSKTFEAVGSALRCAKIALPKAEILSLSASLT